MDEDDYREMAHAMREFAGDIDEGANEAHTAIQGLVGSAGGSLAIEALNAHWGKINGTHLKGLADCGRMAGTAMDGVATLIEGAKLGALVQLGILAAEVIAAQAAAPFTLGLSEVGALGATQATRVIVKRLFKEVCQQVAEQVISIALTPVEEALGAMVGDLVVQLGANALGVKDGVDLGQTAKAGRAGFGQGVGDGKDFAKSAGDKPMELLSAGGRRGGGGGGLAGSGNSGSSMGSGGSSGFSFDKDEHDRAVTSLESAGGTFRNKAGGKIGRARSHHGRTRGKDAIADAANVMLDKVIDGIEDGVKKTAKHLDENMTRGIKQMAKNHHENDRALSDHFKSLGKGGKKDSPISRGGIRNDLGKKGSVKGRSQSRPASLRNGAEEPREHATPTHGRCVNGDPIDMVTGEMVMSQTDVKLPGELSLILRRTHLSSYRSGHWFGRSWASTLDQRLEIDADGAIFASEDGMLLVYPVPVPGEEVLPVEGPRWPLEWDSMDRNRFTITDPSAGISRHFVAPQQSWPATGPAYQLPLNALADCNGQHIELLRNEYGELREIKHSGGYRVGVRTQHNRITALDLLNSEQCGEALPLVRFEYDPDGNLAEVYNSSEQALRFTYDGDGRITSWTDRNDSWYRFFYDERGRVVRGAGADGFLSAKITYDDVRRVTVYTNSLGHSTAYEHNRLGQVVRVTDALGNSTLSAWDRYDRLVRRTDPLGRVTRFEHDIDGNLAAVIRPDGTRATATFNDFRKPMVLVAPDGSTWEYAYDHHGNRTQVIDPSGAVTSYIYNENGHLVSKTDALGNITLLSTNPAGLVLSATNPLGGTTRCTRDAFGRVISITDPLGNTTQMTWTIEGKLQSRTDPDGSSEYWSWDGEGNLVAHTDAMGEITRYESTHFDLPSVRTGVDGVRYEFKYDTERRLTGVFTVDGRVWNYEYDPAGRLIAETDFNGRKLSYAHDAAGQLIARVNGAGQSIGYERDALGRVSQQRFASGACTTFVYDAAGRISQAENSEVQMRFERDALGRTLMATSNGRTNVYAYNALGRRVSRRTPSGAMHTWTYDAHGNPAKLNSSAGSIAFSYDAAGREISRSLGPGVSLTQEWDAASRLTAQAVTAGDGGELLHRAYTHRRDGYLTSVSDGDSHRTYELDALGRITAVQADQWTESYAYDSAGNLTHATTPVGGDSNGDRQHSGTLVQRAGRDTYEYDAQGRVIRRTRKLLNGQARIWTYCWSADDRLTDLTTPDGGRWHYQYDPLGRRTAKQRLAADGLTILGQTVFTWDGTSLVEQVGESGQVTTWDYVSRTKRPIAQTLSQADSDARFYAIVTDPIGAPSELVTSDGQVAWRHRTTAWGAPLSTRGAVDCPLRFPGQYHDEESGLRYNYFRYYSPDTASYLSPDPLGLPAAPNHHAYVVNPLAWVDPLGLESCPDPSLEEVKRKAFRDAGIPWGREPEEVDDWVPATTPEWQGSKQLFDKDHNPIYFPQEIYENDRGDFVVFQNHWTGHREPGEEGYQRPHIHMRPIDDQRNSNYEGCEEHYYYDPNLG
ncbi:RHS repeat-associated core domain-containing protein [Streptomyces sp. DSM 41527]|uniref:RHS repeat-associated core domain-containing protein n=1 Tax=Streptomyces mooreae TaxID=3075523 RepID=A0ABU2T6X7_9ACTN|nr:DUF6531 domain-containing protein [Streptomyces sp. DSM 41527]MDT0455985.1 RHS repeat-associated core domain-containing protein [Streptomyces sp. DSM 41527]